MMKRQIAIYSLVILFAWFLTYPAAAKVKKVDVEDDGPFGHTPSIEVVQTLDQNGQLRYSHFEVSGDLIEPTVDLTVQVGAQCRFAYQLSAAELVTPPSTLCGPDSSIVSSHAFCDEPYYGAHLSAPDDPVVQAVDFTDGNRTLGKRLVDFQVPLEHFIGLIDYGNQAVADRAANLWQEQVIRSGDWVEWVPVDVGFNVRCKRALGYTGIHKWWKGDVTTQQIRVTYRGASAGSHLDELRTPTTGRRFHELAGGPHFMDRVSVDAHLIALPSVDPDFCGLELSATFTSNDATSIQYRLVDDKGVKSPLFELPINQSHTAFAHHTVDLSDREPETQDTVREFGFASRGGTTDLVRFSAHETDRIQGFYQVEVVLPHGTVSNIADFNLESCAQDL